MDNNNKMFVITGVIDINKYKIKLKHKTEEKSWNDDKGKIYKQNCCNYISISIIYILRIIQKACVWDRKCKMQKRIMQKKATQ